MAPVAYDPVTGAIQVIGKGVENGTFSNQTNKIAEMFIIFIIAIVVIIIAFFVFLYLIKTKKKKGRK